MNYIHRLQAQIQEEETKREERKQSIIEYLNYLKSSKFSHDTTVQVWEVQEMLWELVRKN